MEGRMQPVSSLAFIVSSPAIRFDAIPVRLDLK
jgi:hypothetical protein